MEKNKTNTIVAYTDGGSRGNPGPSALGVYIKNLNKTYGHFLGKGTNNEAEYQAIIFALKKIRQLVGKSTCKKISVEIRSDSQLVVKQLNAEYKLKEKSLYEYFIAVWNEKQQFKDVSFVYVPREQNKKADAMVNKTLDEHLPAQRLL